MGKRRAEIDGVLFGIFMQGTCGQNCFWRGYLPMHGTRVAISLFGGKYHSLDFWIKNKDMKDKKRKNSNRKNNKRRGNFDWRMGSERKEERREGNVSLCGA